MSVLRYPIRWGEVSPPRSSRSPCGCPSCATPLSGGAVSAVGGNDHAKRGCELPTSPRNAPAPRNAPVDVVPSHHHHTNRGGNSTARSRVSAVPSVSPTAPIVALPRSLGQYAQTDPGRRSGLVNRHPVDTVGARRGAGRSAAGSAGPQDYLSDRDRRRRSTLEAFRYLVQQSKYPRCVPPVNWPRGTDSILSPILASSCRWYQPFLRCIL